MALLVAIMIVVALALVWFGHWLDRRRWNNGFCRRCDRPWQLIQGEGTGARLYSCRYGHRITISWLHEQPWLMRNDDF